MPRSHSVQDDFARVREALGPRVPVKHASYLERVRNETLDALTRIEEQVEALGQQAEEIEDRRLEQWARAQRLEEQLEAEAQYRVKAEQAIARLEEAVRVCGRHLYDCCRSDINWKLQIETHDQAVNAVAWVECDEPYPQKAQR